MTTTRLVSLLPTACLAATLAAQSATWIVDVHNGPGADFTSLQTAIFSVAPGDMLIVRGGNYQPAVVDRPLTIVGDGNVVITGSGGYMPGFMVMPLPAGTTLSMTGITFAALALTNESLRVSAGPGTVILDRVRSALVTNLSTSDDVRITRSQFDHGVGVQSSTAALDRCTIGPRSTASLGALAASLVVTGSHVVLNRCQVHGQDVYVGPGASLPATPGISLSASTLVLCDDGTGAIAPGVGGSQSAITGTGVVELDPHAVLQPTGSAPAIAGPVAVTKVRPSLAVDAGAPGGIVEVDLFGPTGDGYIEAVGLAVAPTIDPALQDLLWVDPLLLWSIGTFGPTGRAMQQIPLPNSPIIVGISFSWQAASFGVVSGLALSNPVSYVHPL